MTNTSACSWLRSTIVITLIVVIAPIPSSAWGNEGHLMINQIATSRVPPDMPKFFRKAGAQLAYLGSEPDRWRDKRSPQLTAAQSPEHFIDMERVEWMTDLSPDRWQFTHALYDRRASASNSDELLPEKVGLLPYQTIEVYQRLRNAFRQYRQLKDEHQSTQPVEQDIIFYAGWLSHYVADTSQPLHTTVHYDGWVGPNPDGYTRPNSDPDYTKGLHYKFETAFVAQNIKMEDVTAHMHPVQRLTDPYQDYLKFLRGSHSRVEKLYQLDKAKAFDGAGTREGKQFVAEDMTAGAQMLVNMWYTAWLESAQTEPKVEKK